MVKITGYFWIYSILAALLLLAAQCGGQFAPKEKSSVTPAPLQPAEVEHQVVKEEHKHQDVATELAPVSLAEGEQLKVVATTSIVADIVRQVGGNMIDLTPLLPVGSDPHSFQATPQDLANVAQAHVVFANGMGLEEFLAEILKNAGGRAVLVELSQRVEARRIAEEEGKHDHDSEVDPHTWMSPVNVITFVQNIERALSALDPTNAAAYQTNAGNYIRQLEELDTWVKTQIETIPPENRKLVTDHAVFGYYAERYGLEQVGTVIPATTTAAEPSAKELTELEDTIKAYNVKAVFVGNTVNPDLSKQVAEDTETRLLTLYTGSLGTEGSGVESYRDYITYNTHMIVQGLK